MHRGWLQRWGGGLLAGVLAAGLLVAVDVPGHATAWLYPAADVSQSQATGGPAVGIAADGTTTVAWVRNDGSADIVQTATRAAGATSFGSPQNLSTPGQNAVSPQVGVAADGATTVVWAQDDGIASAVVQAATRAAGATSFGSSQDLSDASRSAAWPQVAVAPDGTTTVVWLRADGGQTVVQAATRAAGAASFGSPQDLSQTGGNADTPEVGLAPDGSATAVWRRDSVVQAISSAPIVYPLTVQKSGSGSVTSSPAGIDCGPTCSASFELSSVVTLTAAPAAGSTFTGWGGACSGTASTCTVTVLGARSVTADFAVTPTPTPAKTTTLVVGSHGKTIKANKRSVLVRKVRTNGTVTSARAWCSLHGNKLRGRVADRLCDVTVRRTSASMGRVRITAAPVCTKALRVHAVITAKKAGRKRAVWRKTWRVQAASPITCRINGTG